MTGMRWRQSAAFAAKAAPSAIRAGRSRTHRHRSPRQSTWIPYADRAYWNGCPNQEASMLDIAYLAVGLGFFAAMALYARWAAGA